MLVILLWNRRVPVLNSVSLYEFHKSFFFVIVWISERPLALVRRSHTQHTTQTKTQTDNTLFVDRCEYFALPSLPPAWQMVNFFSNVRVRRTSSVHGIPALCQYSLTINSTADLASL